MPSKARLEHLLRHDLPYRPEALDRVAPDPPVEGGGLRIAQAGTGLGDRDEASFCQTAKYSR